MCAPPYGAYTELSSIPASRTPRTTVSFACWTYTHARACAYIHTFTYTKRRCSYFNSLVYRLRHTHAHAWRGGRRIRLRMRDREWKSFGDVWRVNIAYILPFPLSLFFTVFRFFFFSYTPHTLLSVSLLPPFLRLFLLINVAVDADAFTTVVSHFNLPFHNSLFLSFFPLLSSFSSYPSSPNSFLMLNSSLSFLCLWFLYQALPPIPQRPATPAMFAVVAVARLIVVLIVKTVIVVAAAITSCCEMRMAKATTVRKWRGVLS